LIPIESSSAKSTLRVAAILVVEVVVLTAIALSVQGRPADGVAVRSNQVEVVVNDQSVFDGVTVDRVRTPVPSFVVVQADWGDGEPAEVIGYQAVPAGESELVTVLVNKSKGLPSRVFVSLFADRGERGTFEYSGPMLIAKEGEGMGMGMGGGTTPATGTAEAAEKPVAGGMDSGIDKLMRARGEDVREAVNLTPFSVGVAYGEAALDDVQRSAPGQVTVGRVLAPGPSWVAVSVGGGGPGGVGRIVGSTQVPPGESMGVVVNFEPRGPAEQLVCSLHADLGKRGLLEFDSEIGAKPIDQVYFMELSMMSVAVPGVPQ
jgi:hypothetical protein